MAPASTLCHPAIPFTPRQQWVPAGAVQPPGNAPRPAPLYQPQHPSPQQQWWATLTGRHGTCPTKKRKWGFWAQFWRREPTDAWPGCSLCHASVLRGWNGSLLTIHAFGGGWQQPVWVHGWRANGTWHCGQSGDHWGTSLFCCFYEWWVSFFYFFPHLHTTFPLSLILVISFMVSVDIKHHVYLFLQPCLAVALSVAGAQGICSGFHFFWSFWGCFSCFLVFVLFFRSHFLLLFQVHLEVTLCGWWDVKNPKLLSFDFVVVFGSEPLNLLLFSMT